MMYRSAAPAQMMVQQEREFDDSIRKRKRSDDYTNFQLPPGWLDCPAVGHEIGGILPCKVPLSDSFNKTVVPEKRFSLRQLIHHLRNESKAIGLVIDLTNTDRYYSKADLEKEGIKHVKIACKGRDSVPDNESVNRFVYEVTRFLGNGQQALMLPLPKRYVLVHCTHGHNRTGYMIVHYLMRTRMHITVTQAIQRFAQARPPGIYKPDYIDALYSFYHERKPYNMVVCPSIPEWKRSTEFDQNGNRDHTTSRHQEETEVVMNNDDILGDRIPLEQQDEFRRFCYRALKLNDRGNALQFPGSHPVSLNGENVKLLREHYYYVSWKADGTRYMILITMDGCYLIDRHFNFRRVQMRFPCKHRGVDKRTHDWTLLDGEMVIDTDPVSNNKERRYLVYDIMVLNSVSLVEKEAVNGENQLRPFGERWKMIEEEIIEPRNNERIKTGSSYQYELEPFKVRRKNFYLLSAVPKILEKLIPKLSHAADGLVFQGWDDPYVPRTHRRLLKWKYANMNSVDFLFEVEGQGVGGHHQRLYVHERGKKKLMFEGNNVVEFLQHGSDSDPLSFSGKIIECSWDSDKECWVFMRFRPDKGTPNDINTYCKVVKSIQDNITGERLLAIIHDTIKQPMYAVDRT